ncbi:MAG: hypothetical protein ABI378_08355 [Chitinophagaceae bacterium]
MKRILWLLFIAAFFTVNSVSAQQGRHGDRIHAIKVGYLTDRLNLSPDQATQFWPVYNQFERDKGAARRAFREKYQKGKNIENLDNPGQYIDDNLDYQQQILDLNKSYKDAFLKVISAQQLADLYQAERDFKKLLIQQLRNRRGRN